ncbi:MAG TPA: YihY/virulence factor BrkB family protein [Ktedonobacterales bacterium]|nr:YihY/virulence factor BrkB family protein [Ktedonobacterales bacterium]
MAIRTGALRFWTKFDRDWGWNLARLLAYTLLQALFAVIGLQVVALALALRFGSSRAQDSVIADIARLLPDRVEANAVTAFAHSLRSAPGWLLALGLPVAIWYGSRLFAVLESVLCVIFRRPRRRFLWQNRAALLMLLLFTLLLPIIVLSATAIPRIGVSPELAITIADSDAVANMPWISWVALLAGLVANFLVAQVAYTLLTPKGVSWRAAWPGALVAAALSQGYLLIFPLYVRYVLHPNHFGSVAGFALVALVFLYAYGVFIVIGAEIASLRAGYGPGTGDVTETVARAAQTEREPPAIEAALPSRRERIPVVYPASAPAFDDQPTAPMHVPMAARRAPERD